MQFFLLRNLSAQRAHLTHAQHVYAFRYISPCVRMRRAAITNMHGVKRFLARGKVEGPYSDTGRNMVAHWKLVRARSGAHSPSQVFLPFFCSRRTRSSRLFAAQTCGTMVSVAQLWPWVQAHPVASCASESPCCTPFMHGLA